MSQANRHSLEVAALLALWQVSHSFNKYELGPSECHALVIHLRAKQTRLLPSQNSDSNGGKTMDIIKQASHRVGEKLINVTEKRKSRARRQGVLGGCRTGCKTQ